MIRAVLIDDEPPARVRMRQLLEAAGDVAIVGEAGSAIEAHDVIRDTRPDLLFLDIEMPEVRGTALAASLPEPRPFIVFATAFDRYALEAIAVDATDYLLKPVSRAKLATTLDRVRRRLAKIAVERDVAAASTAQAHLWPGSLPEIRGFDCAAASLAARGVGGDFYDAFQIAHESGDSSWGLLLGDVSGKGVAAGLVASAIQARVNAAARHARLQADALMAAIDRDVYATTDGARYATAIYGVLDADARRLTIVNAGHPAALVMSTCGHVRTLPATGPALGLLDAGAFASHIVSLSPGDIFVAYTDGVIDAIDAAGDEFGERGLTAVVDASRSHGAARICSAVLDAVRLHRGAQQDQDDVTALVIKSLAG